MVYAMRYTLQEVMSTWQGELLYCLNYGKYGGALDCKIVWQLLEWGKNIAIQEWLAYFQGPEMREKQEKVVLKQGLVRQKF